MQTLPFTGPDQQPPGKEHLAASPECVQSLMQNIPEVSGQLERMRRRHFTSILELDAPLVRQLLRLAARYEAGELAGTHPLRCRVLSNLFLDRSQCTGRLAFNAAWLRLGGTMLPLEQNVDQIMSRRYAPDEVAELCNSYSDLTVLRTGDAETFHDILPRFRVPVINAGSGNEEHPSHALADLYLLAKWRPELFQENPPESKGLTIGIVGDPSRTRTLRSLLRLLALFPKAVDRVVLLQRLDPGFSEGQREELEEAGIRVETVREMYTMTATDMEAARELLPILDLVYVHQLQQVHVSRMKIVEGASLLQPHAMVLNPEIQTEEVANCFNDSQHNGYFAQARGSVYVRMALYTAIMS